MENVNNEQALLSVLLLVLTSLATVSGSMPTVQSIETYFDAHAPHKKEHFSNCGTREEPFEEHKKEHFGEHKKEHFGAHKKEHFGAHKKEPFEEHKKEHFGAHKKEHFGEHKKEHFGAHKKEHFSNCGTREEEFKGRNEKFTSQHAHKNDLLEGFEGNMFAKF
jgi:hypothetical protein